MMRSVFLVLAVATMATAFAPSATRTHFISTASSSQERASPLYMGFGMDPEREKLTRDSEPDEYFSTNTDKMSDEEKIPIAIAGLIGISLPFIAGLIALYSAK
mmetsp:Transcript_16126/g.33881  ORF Transcript_16126/g.33881 Transcript_16126/m.33881 type:complete len:103 (-) Transcript_16126:351-659(-)|eukprot:CAMPEP_0171328992 /NCGR_PEP_ID=MMETSP0878-20121228/959_1 /TAXON_ID=67004 /ORGANISM="Thalassiosira weissflogii, Strain CCMP1336" /LENGTH=102 /DNA_ID=CAMNT_0011828879 /DNA_START=178 /DNA_END=486 /DNA_ORIENTATION=+